MMKNYRFFAIIFLVSILIGSGCGQKPNDQTTSKTEQQKPKKVIRQLTPQEMAVACETCIANLRMIREAAIQYVNDTGQCPDGVADLTAKSSSVKGYDGPYLKKIPENPFNATIDYHLGCKLDPLTINVAIGDMDGVDECCTL